MRTALNVVFSGLIFIIFAAVMAEIMGLIMGSTTIDGQKQLNGGGFVSIIILLVAATGSIFFYRWLSKH